MIGSVGEKVLERGSLPQPRPYIKSYGDCGACSLGGILGLSVEQVYSKFDSDGITNANEMGRCLRCSVSYGLADRMLDVPCEWPNNRHMRAFGNPAVNEYLPWFNQVRMAVDAGYYGLAMVQFSAQRGPETDHWVVLSGARTDGPIVGKIITGEVQVSCSVKGKYWIDARDFLQTMGGYETLFIRPKVV